MFVVVLHGENGADNLDLHLFLRLQYDLHVVVRRLLVEEIENAAHPEVADADKQLFLLLRLQLHELVAEYALQDVRALHNLILVHEVFALKQVILELRELVLEVAGIRELEAD